MQKTDKGESERKMKTAIYLDGYVPKRAHPNDAGLDLYTPEDVVVPARGMTVVDTNVAMEIPDGYFGKITSKSGLMLHGITTDGTIDSPYRGHIRVVLFNHSSKDYVFHRGEKIAQLVIVSIITPELEVVTELSDTERGNRGFGSTGK